MANATITVEIAAKSRKTIKALRVVAKELREAADAMPWRPGLRRAAKAARYALKNLKAARK